MSSSLVKLAVKELQCTQAALAKKLGVSEAQISKWIKGDHMSIDMRTKLTKLAKIGDCDPDFVTICGSLEDAKKYDALITYLINWNCEGIDFGLEPEVVSLFLMDGLERIGFQIPKPFPTELIFDCGYEELYKEENEEISEFFFAHPLVNIINSIFRTYAEIDDFIALNIRNLGLNHPDFQENTLPEKNEFELNQIDLAIAKADIDEKIAPLFGRFRNRVLAESFEQLDAIKRQAIESGVPLEAELFDLINKDAGTIEQEMLYSDEKVIIHPDIYMNELLLNTRQTKKMLQKIMAKLEIEEDFE
jgi:transcriptional regulator with XRE-family HTH domain